MTTVRLDRLLGRAAKPLAGNGFRDIELDVQLERSEQLPLDTTRPDLRSVTLEDPRVLDRHPFGMPKDVRRVVPDLLGGAANGLDGLESLHGLTLPHA